MLLTEYLGDANTNTHSTEAEFKMASWCKYKYTYISEIFIFMHCRKVKKTNVSQTTILEIDIEWLDDAIRNAKNACFYGRMV